MQTSRRLHEGSFSALACSFLKLPFFNTTVFYRLGLDGMTTNFRVSYSKNPIKMEEGNEVLRPFADRDSRERIFEADISKKGNMYNITYFDNVVGTVSEYMRPETISRTLVKQETIDIKQGIFIGSEEETTLTLRNHIAHELDVLGQIVNRDGVPLPNPTLFEVDSNLCGQLIGRFNFVEASCYFLQRRDFGRDLIRSNLADEILYEIHAGFRGLYADTWMCSSAGDILANPEEMILQSDEIKAPDVLNNLTGKPLEEIFKENRIVELLGKTPRHEFTDELIGTVLAISVETNDDGEVAECYWKARVCGYDPATKLHRVHWFDDTEPYYEELNLSEEDWTVSGYEVTEDSIKEIPSIKKVVEPISCIVSRIIKEEEVRPNKNWDMSPLVSKRVCLTITIPSDDQGPAKHLSPYLYSWDMGLIRLPYLYHVHPRSDSMDLLVTMQKMEKPFMEIASYGIMHPKEFQDLRSLLEVPHDKHELHKKGEARQGYGSGTDADNEEVYSDPELVERGFTDKDCVLYVGKRDIVQSTKKLNEASLDLWGFKKNQEAEQAIDEEKPNEPTDEKFDMLTDTSSEIHSDDDEEVKNRKQNKEQRLRAELLIDTSEKSKTADIFILNASYKPLPKPGEKAAAAVTLQLTKKRKIIPTVTGDGA